MKTTSEWTIRTTPLCLRDHMAMEGLKAGSATSVFDFIRYRVDDVTVTDDDIMGLEVETYTTLIVRIMKLIPTTQFMDELKKVIDNLRAECT